MIKNKMNIKKRKREDYENPVEYVETPESRHSESIAAIYYRIIRYPPLVDKYPNLSVSTNGGFHSIVSDGTPLVTISRGSDDSVQIHSLIHSLQGENMDMAIWYKALRKT